MCYDGSVIRPGLLEDVESLRGIERAAGQRFAEIGMSEIAEDEPIEARRLAGYVAGGRCWVVVDDLGAPVGYVVVDVIDRAAHVEQLSVVPSHQGRGLGATLLDTVEHWARERRLEALTLTTFANVPWNRPWYERLGFHTLEEGDLSAELKSVRTTEAAHGLDPSARCDAAGRNAKPPRSRCISLIDLVDLCT